MMKRQLKNECFVLLASCLSMLLAMGCGDTVNKDKTAVISEAGDTASDVPINWPKPDSYTGEIPVYEEFAAVEPLFHFNNDTTYVVNFWATWCKPCIKELPYFEALNTALKNEKVKVVLVSLDFPQQLDSKLLPFVRQKQLKSQIVVLLDGKYNDWIDKVSPDWSGAIPATYIYKRDKNQLVAVPFENMDELKTVVRTYL